MPSIRLPGTPQDPGTNEQEEHVYLHGCLQNYLFTMLQCSRTGYVIVKLIPYTNAVKIAIHAKIISVSKWAAIIGNQIALHADPTSS